MILSLFYMTLFAMMILIAMMEAKSQTQIKFLRLALEYCRI